MSSIASAQEVGEELLVRGVLLDPPGQKLHRLGRPERRQRSAQERHLLVLLGGEQLFLLAGPGARDVDRREMRRSNKPRSMRISLFPVPLDSLKITSSLRLPVFTSRVPITVNRPPETGFARAPEDL